MDLKDDEQSARSSALTPTSSVETHRSAIGEVHSRFLQLAPEIIRFSLALPNRLSPNDPMIAVWHEFVDTLRKGQKTRTPTADAATTQVAGSEQHATNHAPLHEPSHRVEGGEAPVQRLCDYGSRIDATSGPRDLGVKTGAKRTYCESVASDAHLLSSYTEEDRRGGDGTERFVIEDDLPASKEEVARGYSPIRKDKSSGNDWGQWNDSEVDTNNHPWSCEQLQWSAGGWSTPGLCTTPTRAIWDFGAKSSTSDVSKSSRDVSPTCNTHHTTSVPAADPPTSSKLSVTYWATIEYGEQAIHVPIKSENIPGAEQWVLEGLQNMQKVWDWVVKKGLDAMIGLQDAFDLAMDMRGNPPSGFLSDSHRDLDNYQSIKLESGSQYSRRGPLSAKKAHLSPTPSDNDCYSVASDVLSG